MHRTRILSVLLSTLAAAAALPAQNPYVRAGARVASAADLRARAVGDLLTITIQEQHSVKNEDKTERKNDTSLAARLEAYTLSDKTFKSNVLPSISVTKEQDFTGESKQNSGSDVRASIAVMVVDVQPNGNLVVAGQRSVTVNDETKTLRISGIVRSLDVTNGNTVSSAQVADARIAIHGEGGGTRQVTKGPVGQLFDTLIWAAWPF
ncbi:MAG: flagellar basal body L-ring protein FlgH [Planctomycetota bacterium]